MEKLLVFCLMFAGAQCSTTVLPFNLGTGSYHRGGSIRLVNGHSHTSGRVEVYFNGRWGTVCDDNFDNTDARVICRMLGFQTQTAYVRAFRAGHFGQGSGSIHIDELQCRGYEADISQCVSQPWGTHDCNHNEDAGVDCGSKGTIDYYYMTSMASIGYGDVRLMGGGSYYGRLEIFVKNEWTTVCSNTLDHNDIKSICRSIGQFRGSIYGSKLPSTYYGQGSTYNIIHRLDCNGHESSVGNCYIIANYTNRYCTHSQDAGINCRELANEFTSDRYPYTTISTTRTPYSRLTTTAFNGGVRLVGGGYSYGRVEIYQYGRWMTVCSRSLDHNVIKVICRSIGYYRGSSYGSKLQPGTYGQGSSSYVIHSLGCYGYESSLSQCGVGSSYVNNYCSHHDDASIDCGAYYVEMTTQDPYPYRQTTEVFRDGEVRLVGGGYYYGRVEIFHDGRWMTVCSRSLDHNDIKVICRSTGNYYGSSYGSKLQPGTYGRGSSSYVIHSLGCNGYESSLSQCGVGSSYVNNYCSHYDDASINCAAYYVEMTTQDPYPYRQTTEGHTLEDAITVSCNEFGWDIYVNLYKLRQRYPNARGDSIYMGENSCVGVDDGYVLHFTQGLRQCLTSQMIRNDVLVYRNQLVYAERDPVHPFLIRHYNWTVDVECDVMRNETSSGHLHHNTGGSSTHQISGTSHYAVNMSYYSDPNFRYQLHGNPLNVNVGDKVYVKVFSPATDWTIKMKVHTCYTKPNNGLSSTELYYIIKNGCEVDTNTHIISQSTHETRFVFEDFEYASNHEGIYIYCDATFCPSSDYSTSCSQTCNPVIRRRRLPHVGGASDTENDMADQQKADSTDEPVETTDPTMEEVTELP